MYLLFKLRGSHNANKPKLTGENLSNRKVKGFLTFRKDLVWWSAWGLYKVHSKMAAIWKIYLTQSNYLELVEVCTWSRKMMIRKMP